MPPKTMKGIAQRPDLVFDIETIPDAALCRKVYGTPDMSNDEAVAAALKALHREEKGMLPEAYHKPIVIAACLIDYAANTVEPLLFIEGRPRSPDEESLLRLFWETVVPKKGGRSPRLVSFNGKSFDMRVMETRSLQYESLACPAYFQPTDKFDTYRHKFSDDEHLDLVEFIPNYGSKAGFSLRTIAALIGLPGKDQMDGAQVYPAYREGRIMEIAAYCLEDVIQTALIKMRLDRLRGILAQKELHRRIAWFLDTVEAYLVESVLPAEPAFSHTLQEIRKRYRPALIADAASAQQSSSKTPASPAECTTDERNQTAFPFGE